MRQLFSALIVLLLAVATATATAQGDEQPVAGGILTIDPDRLFQETGLGQRLQAELDRLRSDLKAENGRLDQELIAEEAELAARRPAMPVDEFRALADAFNEKAEAIRAAQKEKLQNLTRRLEEDRQRFINAMRPILAQVIAERGGVIVIERRMVFLAADSVDITDELISRIDAATGGEARGTVADTADGKATGPQPGQ